MARWLFMGLAQKKFDDIALVNYQLRSIDISYYRLEYGGELKNFSLEYIRIGEPDKPLLVVQGGISSNRNLVDTSEDQGWWNALIGSGKAIDTLKYQILAVNYVYSAKGDLITTKDQAGLIDYLLNQLGINYIEKFIGCSYGGLVGQSYATNFPKKINHLICICAALESTSTAIAQRAFQRKILKEVNNELLALELARYVAMIGYRGKKELNERFSITPQIKQQTASFEIDEYLNYNANKFSKKFNAKQYICLSNSIDIHQVKANLIKCRCDFIAFDSDQIVTIEKVKFDSKKISQSSVHEITTDYGHDAFLIENKKIEKVLLTLIGK